MTTTAATTSPVHVLPAELGDLQKELARDDRTTLAILDAADDERVLAQVDRHGGVAASLYAGESATEMREAAPYLVRVDDALLGWVREVLWGEPWGIFAVTDVGLPDARKHFRKFLMVEGPDGEELYFRFYDPRILPVFLQASNAEEAKTLFGPIRSFWVVSSEGVLSRIVLR